MVQCIQTLATDGTPVDDALDPSASAEVAGLRYVTDERPRISRKRAGKSFYYVRPDGTKVSDERTLTRIKILAIPPAYSQVWICADPRGHLQPTGRDARGRKQYRYHPKWRTVRDAVKYDRMVTFAEALPAIRERVDRDLSLPGLPREKVLATVVRLLEQTHIRIGSEEYKKANKSFGLTTLQDRHAHVSGTTLKFTFKGKHGIPHDVTLRDRRLARIVQRCRDIPGQDLFQYVDSEGMRHDVTSGDVNAYLREIAGYDCTAKDFRTWAGTMLAARYFRDGEPCESETDAKSRVLRCIELVATHLGNTVAVCRKCYVHPSVVDAFLSGAMPSTRETKTKLPSGSTDYVLTAEEAALIDLLRATSPSARS